MLVPLEVGFQVIFCELFVNLKRSQYHVAIASEKVAPPLQMDLPHRIVRPRARDNMLARENAHRLEVIPTHDLFESRVVSWRGGAAVVT